MLNGGPKSLAAHITPHAAPINTQCLAGRRQVRIMAFKCGFAAVVCAAPGVRTKMSRQPAHMSAETGRHAMATSAP
jgi:hypothetical protein